MVLILPAYMALRPERDAQPLVTVSFPSQILRIVHFTSWKSAEYLFFSKRMFLLHVCASRHLLHCNSKVIFPSKVAVQFLLPTDEDPRFIQKSDVPFDWQIAEHFLYPIDKDPDSFCNSTPKGRSKQHQP